MTMTVASKQSPEGTSGRRGGLARLRSLASGHLFGKIGVVLGVMVVGALVLAFFWSREPELFDVREQALAHAGDDATKVVPGYVTTAAVAAVATTLLDKTGGYLSNDMTPPSLLLDNMPSWEYGVLTELRDVTRTLRNDFGRAQTQSGEDTDLVRADAQFHFDANHWILPAAESEYRTGIDHLHNYLERLAKGDARFYVRADNLNAYLATVEKRLGSLAQRLSESVREPILREMISETPAGPSLTATQTPWLAIDDVFFEARGYVWALLHILRGVEVDFRSILENKNGAAQLTRIIEKLEKTQHAILSPIILNTTGFGMLTNHSLVMASYISRANAAVIDLRILLAQG